MNPRSSSDFIVPQKVAPLACLPHDCWRLILEYLSQRDLSSLSIASKGLQSSVKPVMYRSISWSWDTPPLRRVLQLLRSVLANPELASHIQHVSLISHTELDPSNCWTPPTCDIAYSQEDHNFKDVVWKSQEIIKDANFPDPGKWNQAIETGDVFALVSIILSQLHNLKTLRLDYSFVWLSGFPGLMLEHALFSTPRGSSKLSTFDFLQDVEYGSNVPKSKGISHEYELENVGGFPACNPAQFSAWFYLPRLRSLAIWLRSFPELEYPGEQTNLHQLQSLVLARATIQEDQVPVLLSRATSLTNLSLGLAYRWGREICLANGSAIRQSFGYVRHTLRNLALCLEYYPSTVGDVEMEEEEEETHLNFRDLFLPFKSLDFAEVPITLTSGWKTWCAPDIAPAVPPNLQQLCLRVDFASLASNAWHIDRLLNYIERQLPGLCAERPNLKRLTLRSWIPHKFEFRPEQRRAVEESYARAGIQFNMICDTLSPGLWASDALNHGDEGL